MKKRIFARQGFVVYGGSDGGCDIEMLSDDDTEVAVASLSAEDVAALRTTFTTWQRDCRRLPHAPECDEALGRCVKECPKLRGSR